MNLLSHAEKELRIAGFYDKDVDYGFEKDELGNDVPLLASNILKLVDLFSEQGHSGFSASIVIKILEKLLRFEPLTPLTGNDDEWNEVGTDVFQNNRCSHIFKDGKDGIAYDIQGIVWLLPPEEGGGGVTNYYSRVPVTFPYTPHIEYAPYSDPRNLNNKEEKND